MTARRFGHQAPRCRFTTTTASAGLKRTGFLGDISSDSYSVDSTKPSGQWNHFRIVISPKKCETDVNGVKYYDWTYNSPDFWERVAKSKFSQYPGFAKLNKGAIGLQGDHVRFSSSSKTSNCKPRVTRSATTNPISAAQVES